MSEVVDRFPPPSWAKYDWHRWIDGQIHKCTRGDDFEDAPQAFAKAAYHWAIRHEHRATVSVRGDVVYVQFRPGRSKRKGPTLARALRNTGLSTPARVTSCDEGAR